jgi:two-component system CheB/CheR fusion protein
VGIGASAGGLEAFTQFLSHLPNDTGLGFVLVQHLDPSHQSMLPELLSKATRMSVTSVADGMLVQPNEVYVIPPNRTMTIAQGVLRLQPRERKHGYRPVDEFFRSLGEDQKNRGIGVVLSGTASDGTIGLESIKAEGGITFAQDASAKFDGMPRSAIAAGHVDFVLSPGKIAEQIVRIGRHPQLLSAPPTRPAETASPADSKSLQNGYQEILELLRKGTRMDFTNYRANTIRRRITRRMILHQIKELATYATYLRNHPAETEALMQDLLISVTSFFRNPEVFVALKEQVFPKLLEHRETDEPVRIWVYGCSTGEEAYSIAMTFLEVAEERGKQVPVQIYATDLNAVAIDRARRGLYPKRLVHDMSPERLRRFFVETEAGYQVNKAIREMCIFARQNLLTDPPFSRMDLVSCRNVLIYMEPVLTRRIIPMFHYALKPNGFLFLGLSETVGTDTDLFVPIDRKSRIYAKKTTPSRARFGLTAVKLTSQQPGEPPREAPAFDPQKEAVRILLTKLAPASVLVDGQMEILQVRGSTRGYLEAPTGKPTHNVLKMVRQDLVLPLRRALQQAKTEERGSQTARVRFKDNGKSREIWMEVVPIRGPAADELCFLILFHSVTGPADSQPAQSLRKRAGTRPSNRPGKRLEEGEQLADLRQQFDAAREYSQSLLEQQEAYVEEMQSANEEIQSSNEELQSINEELETAKEELQSINEELTTMNEELQNRILETHHLNADLTNLLTSARMPILMMDSEFRIRRFTPSAAKALNLIDTDVGRPITDMNLEFEIPNLPELLSGVISEQNARELEVRDRQGRWYEMYLGPYRTPENKIDGVVLVLTDIQVLKENEQSIMAARHYAESIVETVRQPLVILNGELRVKGANASFYEMFQASPADTENQLIYDIGNKQWNIPKLRKLLYEVLPLGTKFWDFEVQHDFPGRGTRTLLINARKLHQHGQQEPLILMAIEDITSHKLAAERDRLIEEEKLARFEAEELSRAKDQFLATVSHELRTPLNSILGWSSLLSAGQMKESDTTRALASIERNARAQAKLIEDLVDSSRIIGGKFRLDFQDVDLAAVVVASMDSVCPAASAKRIQMVLRNESGPVLMLGDPQRLQQVVWNLLTNAVKFTPPEGRIDVRLDRLDSETQISVTDTGQGIKAEFMPYLFQRFRQADSSTTRKHAGLGLGLAIVRHLVEMHGGTVRAESQGEGRGSTFIIRLPLRAVPPAVSIPELSAPHVFDDSQLLAGSPVAASLENLPVLVVDDEDDTRNLLTAVLEQCEAEVKTAASASEALRVLARWKPAVLVCDIGMPDQDGYAFIREVRQLPPEQGGLIPALALTAYGKEEDRRRALEAGYQAHMTKPASPPELVSLVNRLAANGMKK